MTKKLQKCRRLLKNCRQLNSVESEEVVGFSKSIQEIVERFELKFG